MIAAAIVILAVWIVCGVVVAGWCMKASDGYEDATGFHAGEAPLQPMPSQREVIKSFYEAKLSLLTCPINAMLFGRNWLNIGFNH